MFFFDNAFELMPNLNFVVTHCADRKTDYAIGHR